MTEEKESRTKYIGQLVTLFALGILMLLFRIAVPVSPAIGGLQVEYRWLIGEVIYTVIEGFLIVILVNHLIFKNTYKEMGIVDIKKNIFSLIGHVLYLGIAFGITYGLNWISGVKSTYSGTYIISHIVILFISTAFLQEVIYRGCILNGFLKLTGRKVWLSVIGATLLFMVIHIPLTMLETNFESLFTGNMSQIAIMSFGLGLYFSLLYYWTNNLWLCVIMHGTYSSINVVAEGLLQPVFKIVYILGALIYLLYVAIRYMRSERLEDEDQDEISSEDEVTKEIEQDLGDEVIQEVEKLGQAEEKEKVVDIADFKTSNPIDTKTGFSEDLSQSAIISLEERQKKLALNSKKIDSHSEEDLSKTAIIPLQDQKKDLSQTTRIPIQKQEKEVNKIDLNQTAFIDLVELEAAQKQKEDLSKTSIIKVADLEAHDRNTQMLKQHVADKKQGQVTKFKEEPSYMNHLEHYLGEFESIYKQVTPTDPPIDILSFQGEKFNALVTNGMRYLPMNVPEYLKGNAYAELVMFVDKSFDISDEGLLKEENSWLLQSLRNLALYPREADSYLGWGHTVGNGEERTPYYRGYELCGMLIYPPVAQDDMKFYTFKEGEKITYIYNVMPLYTEEIDFILKHSGDAYFDRIREMGISQVITRNRTNACL